MFWNSYSTLLDVQRRTLEAQSLRQPSPGSVEIGEEEHVIPVPREELQVGKRQVFKTKTLRIRATVKEVPVEQHLDLRTETVFVQRRPSTSPPGSEDFNETLIEVREMHEEPVVAKVVRQSEEVVISKVVSTHRATIHDVLRETHVEIDDRAEHVQAKPESRREVALLESAADKPQRARRQPRAQALKKTRAQAAKKRR